MIHMRLCRENPNGPPSGLCDQFAASNNGFTGNAGDSLFAYNYSGLPAAMADYLSASTYLPTTWAYDAQGQPTSQTDLGGSVGYTYDAAGDNTCVAYPVASGSNCANPASSTNTVVNYGYDADGRMNAMSDWLGNSFTFGYDTRSNLTSIVYPSATTWTENLGPYDAANNMGSLALNSTKYTSTTTAYPPNANEELAAAGSTNYGYDSQNHIQTAGSDSFTYRPDGALATSKAGTTTQTFSYDPADELTTQKGGLSTTSFSFDANGNRCAHKSGTTAPSCTSPTSGTTSYGYNGYNQLFFTATNAGTNASCTSPPSGATTYAYNGEGLRIGDQTGSTTQIFEYDTVTRASQPLIIDDGYQRLSLRTGSLRFRNGPGRADCP